jgi:peptide/nickel transport system permease protein
MTGRSVAPTVDTLPGPLSARTNRRPRFWSRFAKNRLALGGAIILGLLIVLALIGPLIVGSPTAQDVRERLQPPSWSHWFGTDELGRDIFTRVVHGARVSIVAGLIAVMVSLVGGILLGLTAGYVGRGVGLAVMALVDLMLALPAILLAITIAARLGPGLTSAMLAAGLVGLPGYARLSRASTLTIKQREFVTAAVASGASGSRIMARHILPNIVTPLIVQATIGVGNAILLVSALGFLGLGAQPPQPEWGRMLSDAQRYILDAPTIGVFPGLGIALTVLGFNLAGDGLRDALDPAERR